MAKQVIGVGTTANDGTGDPIRDAFVKVNANFTELYTDDAGDVGSITATAPIARDSATGAVTISLNDDGITFAKLGVEYTAVVALSSAATIAVDTALADVFTYTAGHSATLNFTNVGIGDMKTFMITGGGSSYTVTLGTSNGSACTFNKIAGTYDDTGSTKNLIQIKWIAVNEAWFTISQIAS